MTEHTDPAVNRAIVDKDAPVVTVLSRGGCHSCEKAEADVDRICTELGVRWSVSDVDADPELRAEYGDMVPVILIRGKEHGYWTVEEERFRAALGHGEPSGGTAAN